MYHLDVRGLALIQGSRARPYSKGPLSSVEGISVTSRVLRYCETIYNIIVTYIII